jgi:hypothetical protein
VAAALPAAQAAGQELVVFFALAGRPASERMQAGLQDPEVLAALRAGRFATAIADGTARADLFAAWLAGREGMGIAVLDAEGRCYAARPGPQDPPELAAFLRACAAARAELAALRGRLATASRPSDQHALGALLLELGCRHESRALLEAAAKAGVADARHRLARLCALDGDVAAARRWLAGAPRTGAAQVTEGYVLFKERRHAAAIDVFEAALRQPLPASERQRAQLYLGKALHEDKQDGRAVALLEALRAEATGSTFEAAAAHALAHIRAGDHGHAH